MGRDKSRTRAWASSSQSCNKPIDMRRQGTSLGEALYYAIGEAFVVVDKTVPGGLSAGRGDLGGLGSGYCMVGFDRRQGPHYGERGDRRGCWLGSGTSTSERPWGRGQVNKQPDGFYFSPISFSRVVKHGVQQINFNSDSSPFCEARHPL